MKNVALAYIVTHLLTKAEKKPLARLFCEINKDHDGLLSKEEISEAYELYFGNPIDSDDINKLFRFIDVSGSDQIEYTEFMLACTPERVMLTNENLAIVFKIFDEDCSGTITKDEIKMVFHSINQNITDKVAKEIMDEVDANGDGELSFEEFSYLMKNVT